MIQDACEQWLELTRINADMAISVMDGVVPVIKASNVFAEPEALLAFCIQQPWWKNRPEKPCVRPGKTLLFPAEPPALNVLGQCFNEAFASMFGLRHFKCESLIGNCFNGNMTLGHSVLGAYPHTDTNCHLAVNVSLTPQSSVKTGFWSANAKPSILDFTHDDYNALDRCMNQLSQHHEQETHRLGVETTWFQVNDTEFFTLQDIVEIGFNEALLYPAHFFHNPYIPPTTFIDEDRITLAAFLSVQPEAVDETLYRNHHAARHWEIFHLIRVLNYLPDYEYSRS